MELRIEPYKAPEQILFNYEELKKALSEKCEIYETMVYTEDQIQNAKSDRANLNKLKKALNDERLKREREYMTNFNVFKGQVNEIIGIIDKSINNVDKQVKLFDEKTKAEKLEEIKAVWAELLEADEIPAGICFKQIFDEKWLNVSVKMPAIQKAINEKLEQIIKELSVIENLPAFAFEAKEIYINTLDLAKAVSEAKKMQEIAEKKAAWEAEQEKKKAEETKAPEPQPVFKTNINDPEDIENLGLKKPVKFVAWLSVDDAKALKEFFNSRNIEFKAI